MAGNDYNQLLYLLLTTTMSSLAAIRRLPLFMAYCPDASGVLAKRLEVRAEHLKRWAQDRESGRGCTSSSFLPVTPSILILCALHIPIFLLDLSFLLSILLDIVGNMGGKEANTSLWPRIQTIPLGSTT
jgi:hypothetical protein